MSIPVPLDDLAAKLEDFPWGYLVTVRDDGRAQSLAVPTQYVDGVLVASVGRRTAENAVARPAVTLMFPGATGADYSLIVDGDAHVEGDRIAITPTWAVMHRPALPAVD
ncbi:MAG: pyridoxamine 5'-phosphate oxidase family protein [Candidatus Nanopelagicales bacterium]